MGLPCGTFNISYAEDMAIIRTKTQWLLFALFLVFAFAIPFIPLFSGYILTVLIYICITIVVVMGLNLLTGLCGQISIGQSAFMGIGGFAAALIVLNSPLPFWAALPCAGIAAGLTGLIFGFPSLRVRGLYLALATLAAQFIIHYCLVHFLGGDVGLHVSPPELGGIVFASDRSYYYIVLVIALIMGLAAKNIARTRVGRALVATRDNDIAAEVMGVDIFRYKLLAFFVGCFYAGIAGALWVFYLGVASAEHYDLFQSIWYLGMIVVGGLGSIIGTVFGVVFIRVLQEITYVMAPAVGQALPAISGNVLGALPEIVFSLVVLLFLIFEPRGLHHRWEIFKTSYRLWPFAH